MPNGFEPFHEDESPPDLRGQGGDEPTTVGLPEDPAELQEMIDDILDIALNENGYSELLDWTPEQIVTDLGTYCQDVEGIEGAEAQRLLGPISDWQRRRKNAQVAPR